MDSSSESLKSKAIVRLMRDLKELQDHPLPGIAVCIPRPEYPLELLANIKIMEGPFKDFIVPLEILIPTAYPFKGPSAYLVLGFPLTYPYHEHIRAGSICVDLLTNFSYMYHSSVIGRSGWAPSYTLATTLLQLQVFIADPDLPSYLPKLTKNTLAELFEKVKQFKHPIRISSNEVKIHSYTDPYPPFEETPTPEIRKDDINDKESAAKNRLCCSFSRASVFDESKPTLGYPLNVQEDQFGRFWPSPVLEMLSYDTFQGNFTAYSDVLKQRYRLHEGQDQATFYSTFGEPYNAWIPIYISAEHYKNGKEHLMRAFRIFKYGFEAKDNDVFDPNIVLEVLPNIINKTVVQILKGELYQSVAAIEAYCHFYRLFVHLVKEFELQEKIDAKVESIFKGENYRSKSALGDMGEFLVLLANSKYGLFNEEVNEVLIEEYFARQVMWVVRADPTLRNRDALPDFVPRFFKAAKVSNQLLCFAMATANFLLKDCSLAEFDAWYGCLPTKKIEQLRNRLKTIRKSVKGDWQVLINTIGLQKKVSSKEEMSKLLRQAFIISGRQGYTKIFSTKDIKDFYTLEAGDDASIEAMPDHVKKMMIDPKMVKGYPLVILTNRFEERQVLPILRVLSLAQFKNQGLKEEYKLWIPFYIMPAHYRAGRDQLMVTLREIKRELLPKDSKQKESSLTNNEIMEIFVMLLKGVVFKFIKGDFTKARIILNAYFELGKLFREMIKERKMQGDIDRIFEDLLKDRKSFSREYVPDLISAVMLLPFSSFQLSNKELNGRILMEHWAREFPHVQKNMLDLELEDKDLMESYIQTFMRYGNGNSRLEFSFRCMALFIQEVDDNNNSEELSELTVQPFQTALRNSLLRGGDWKGLISSLGLSESIQTEQHISHLIRASYNLAFQNRYVSIHNMYEVVDLLVQYGAVSAAGAFKYLEFNLPNFEGKKESVKKSEVMNADFLGFSLQIFEAKNGRCWLTCKPMISSWRETSTNEDVFWVPCSINNSYHESTKNLALTNLRNAYCVMKGTYEERLTPKMLVELFPKMLSKMLLNIYGNNEVQPFRMLSFIQLYQLFIRLIETCRAGKFIQRRLEGYIKGEYYKTKLAAEDVIELLILRDAIQDNSDEKQFNKRIVEDLIRSSVSFYLSKHTKNKSSEGMVYYSLFKSVWNDEKDRMVGVVCANKLLKELKSHEILKGNFGNIPEYDLNKLSQIALSQQPVGWTFLFSNLSYSSHDGENLLAALIGAHSEKRPEKTQQEYEISFPTLDIIPDKSSQQSPLKTK